MVVAQLFKRCVFVCAVGIAVSSSQLASAYESSHTNVRVSNSSPQGVNHHASRSLKDCEVNGFRMSHNSLHYFSENAYVACSNGKGGCYLTQEFHHSATQISCPTADLEKRVKEEANRRDEHRRMLEAKHGRRLSLAVASGDRLWPKGVMCYDFSSELPFDAHQRRRVAEAMRVFETTSNVRFLPIQTCKDKKMDFCKGCSTFVDFKHPPVGRDCNASIGVHETGPQIMNLADRCFEADDELKSPIGTAMHEIGHSLGLYHEHQHPGREIAVFWDELPQGLWGEMKARDLAVGAQYDVNSIMHYPGSYEFCYPRYCAEGEKAPNCVARGTKFCGLNDDGSHCVAPTKEICDEAKTAEIGQRKFLSAGDLEALNELYGQAAWPADQTKIMA